MPNGTLLLDACSLINLYATGHFGDIARANGVRFRAVREVLGETFFIEGVGGERTEADLAELEAVGELVAVDLTADEQATFIGLASELDDGEAATLAAALHRELWLATDDRRALRLIQERDLPITPLSTSELIRRWADERGISPREIGEVLRRVETAASFVPSAGDPNRQWWRTHVALVEE